MRTQGDDHDPKRFSTWAAKVICGIGMKYLHDTLMDRSITFELRRKLPSEPMQTMKRA